MWSEVYGGEDYMFKMHECLLPDLGAVLKLGRRMSLFGGNIVFEEDGHHVINLP